LRLSYLLLRRQAHRDHAEGTFLSNALKQLSTTTGVISSLMEKCETMAQQLNESTGGPRPDAELPTL
jgi:hypothetical protein